MFLQVTIEKYRQVLDLFLILIKDPFMKKYEVTIEETCAETFEFEVPENVDIYEYVREKYYKCNIVLEPGECQFRQMKIHNLDNGSYTEWTEF